MVALLHVLLIVSLGFKMETMIPPPESAEQVMKLTDIQEYLPPPPPIPLPPVLPPPPQAKVVEPQQNVVEAATETMIETDKVPEDQLVAKGLLTQAHQPPVQGQGQSQEIEYLSQSKVSKIPSFSDQDLRRITAYLRDQYPPIALRSGIEGVVILEMFIDPRGKIQRIQILKEEPAERGFGEVAERAFKEIRASPAEANGTPVGVRFRYPIRFTIKS